MDQMKDFFMLDMYLSPHVNTLYSWIRQRALRQVNKYKLINMIKYLIKCRFVFVFLLKNKYFSPYKSADLLKMAAAFNTTPNALEEELINLILDGHIQARIDSQNKVCLNRNAIIKNKNIFIKDL